MGGLGRCAIDGLCNPIHYAHRAAPMPQLVEVLSVVGSAPLSDSEIAYIGGDAIANSVLPVATMTAVRLMAKAISVRGGTGHVFSQPLSPLDRKRDVLIGHPPGNPTGPTNPSMQTNMWQSRRKSTNTSVY